MIDGTTDIGIAAGIDHELISTVGRERDPRSEQSNLRAHSTMKLPARGVPLIRLTGKVRLAKIGDWSRRVSRVNLFAEDSLTILAAIRREEKKVKKQLAKLQGELSGLQSAAAVLGKSASRDFTAAKKRVLSAAGRAKIRYQKPRRNVGQR